MKKTWIAVLAVFLSGMSAAQEKASVNLSLSDEKAVEKEACEAFLEADDAMHFNQDTLIINKMDCAEFTLHLKHTGKLPAEKMGHNVVIAKITQKDSKDDFEDIVQTNIAAGVKNNYVQQNDRRIIAHTDLIGGGEETKITFKTNIFSANFDYVFFCSAPEHAKTMRGTVVVAE